MTEHYENHHFLFELAQEKSRCEPQKTKGEPRSEFEEGALHIQGGLPLIVATRDKMRLSGVRTGIGQLINQRDVLLYMRCQWDVDRFKVKRLTNGLGNPF